MLREMRQIDDQERISPATAASLRLNAERNQQMQSKELIDKVAHAFATNKNVIEAWIYDNEVTRYRVSSNYLYCE